MAQPVLRAGILGAGYISDYHVSAIKRMPGVELAAICDLNTSAAKKLAGKDPVAIYSDLTKMLAEANLDVVHVLTQPDSHYPLTKMVLEAGCDALIEKPATISSKEAEELAALAKQKNRGIAVNHNFVFSRPFNKLKAAIDSGELGPLKSVRVVWKRPLGQMNAGPWNLWMLREPGNIMFESGSHSLSELLSIVKDPKFVSVTPRLPKTLPSGALFFRRWNIAALSGDTWIQIDMASDQGYDQHYVEVEGMFGVARADIENDVYYANQPTGRAYDVERLHVNLRAGRAKIGQAFGTYANYAYSKLNPNALGAPYQASMFMAIENCYAQLRGSAPRPECSIEYAIGVARCAEKIIEMMPAEARNAKPSASTIPATVSEPALDATVLIVGATGFIGKQLLAQLQAKGHKIRLLVRNPSSLAGVEIADTTEIIVGDFRNTTLMDKVLKGIEHVYHLAVAHGNSLDGYISADTNPTLAFAAQCQAHGIKRFIYTGTIDSLDLAKPHAIKESDGVDKNIKRRNNYAHSKAITEERLMDMHRERNFPLVIVRPAIVLGKGGPVAHVGVANWFGLGRCAYWGKGENLLPLVLVEDVASGLVAALDAPGIEGKTYNLSAAPCISARDYVREVEQAIGSKITAHTSHPIKGLLGDLFKWSVKTAVRHPDRKRIPSFQDWKCREQHAHFDTSAAAKDLNWRPTNDKEIILEKGVREPARETISNM